MSSKEVPKRPSVANRIAQLKAAQVKKNEPKQPARQVGSLVNADRFAGVRYVLEAKKTENVKPAAENVKPAVGKLNPSHLQLQVPFGQPRSPQPKNQGTTNLIKYKKMLNMGLPIGAVKRKMMMDGISTNITNLDNNALSARVRSSVSNSGSSSATSLLPSPGFNRPPKPSRKSPGAPPFPPPPPPPRNTVPRPIPFPMKLIISLINFNKKHRSIFSLLRSSENLETLLQEYNSKLRKGESLNDIRGIILYKIENSKKNYSSIGGLDNLVTYMSLKKIGPNQYRLDWSIEIIDKKLILDTLLPTFTEPCDIITEEDLTDI
jgi:hypothetical protein